MFHRKLSRQITLALIGGSVLTAFSSFAGVAHAEDVVDFGGEDVYAEKAAVEAVPVVEEKKEEPKAEPQEEPRPEAESLPGGELAKDVQLGVLGDRKTIDTPFSVSAYTEEAIRNSSQNQLADFAEKDASVNTSSVSVAATSWFIRGFKSSQQDVQLNGLYGIAPRFYGGIENLDRVDILKGPSALLSGISPGNALGGTVNYITKRATQEPITRAILKWKDGVTSEQIDFGRRTDDGRAGIRVNVYNANGDNSMNEGIRTDSLHIGADYKGDRYRIGFDYGYIYNRNEDFQYRLTIGTAARNNMGSMFTMPRDSKFGGPGTYRDLHEQYGMIHGEYDFNDNLTAFLSYGMRTTKMEYFYNTFTLNNGTTGSSRLTYSYNNQVNKAQSGEVGVRGKFQTGNLNHELTLTANRVAWTRYMLNRSQSALATTTNLWNPVFRTGFSSPEWAEPKADDNTLTGFGIMDIISTPNEKWSFLLGGRQQQVDMTTYKTAASSSYASQYNESVFTPAFAIIYKPTKNSSIYANYMQGLDTTDNYVSDTAATNYGASFAPFKTKSYEVGAKLESGKYATSLALFQISSPTLVEDATNTYAPTGEYRHRGVEWSLAAEPHKGTKLSAGLMYLDATYTKSLAGVYNGNRIPGTSRWNAVLGVEQDIKGVPGLSLSTNMRYTGDTYIDSANAFRVSPWVTWDLGAKYRFTADKTPMTLRFDVYNLFNRNYWRGLDNNSIFLGKERTYAVTLTMDF